MEGFLERTLKPIDTSGKVDIPKRYIGRRVYVLITKNQERFMKKIKSNCASHS